ncbi:MAG: hypothetical protein Q9166_003906 [cf. Caloplaca sp. 2 TL-2023]
MDPPPPRKQSLRQSQGQQVFRGALLRHSTAFNMVQLLERRIKDTNSIMKADAVLRADARSRLKVDGNMWEERQKELKISKRLWLQGLRKAEQDVSRVLVPMWGPFGRSLPPELVDMILDMMAQGYQDPRSDVLLRIGERAFPSVDAGSVDFF